MTILPVGALPNTSAGFCRYFPVHRDFVFKPAAFKKNLVPAADDRMDLP